MRFNSGVIKNRQKQMNIGIEAIEIYFPNTYVDQQDLEKHNKVSEGKYTKGLGQLQLSFACPFEDVNSMALTVVNNLLQKHRISPSQVGRLEVGTETLADKSKSTKTVLMSLFQGHHDIEGATSLNACYGATNALLNTLNWMSSPSWDGRYGIVVASDVAVYEDGPARPTGGAGAVALLISKNPKISFSSIRASYVDNQYDFYKPIPSSEYPLVDGKLSIESYLKAVRECYSKLKEKAKTQNILGQTDYVCFHCPYYKMVQKAFSALASIDQANMADKEISTAFLNKVEPTLYISQRVGNIYTGSLYACLFSLLYRTPQIANKKVLLFSYGSGLCSTMLQATVHSNPLTTGQIEQTTQFLANRTRFTVQQYTQLMLEKEQEYGKFRGKINVDQSLLSPNVFYLTEIDSRWRRSYAKTTCSLRLTNSSISFNQKLYNDRIINLIDKKVVSVPETGKFYKLSIEQRRKALNSMIGNAVDSSLLQSGGISTFCADKMIENVIGKLALPIGVIPSIFINHKNYSIPMAIEEPSVVAATSSIAKFISPHSFISSSSPSIMIGQVHLPSLHPAQLHALEKFKPQLIQQLNESCPSMLQRKGGVKEIRFRNIDSVEIGSKDYSLDILIDVKEAMGANLINTIAERAKEIVSRMGIRTGISILSNYCVQRMANSTFVIPVQQMSWKGYSGLEVASKILQAYEFARKDPYRAVTHNKGIMNGIDAVCLATGQDWRAIESGAHAYASRTGKYQPMTHYRIFERDSVQYFEGKIELPIAVGTVGGAITRNPLYKSSLMMMGLPSAQELAEILASVGLAQNFAALRALAIEGIQKGHMQLHCRAIAVANGVPKHQVEECCRFMAKERKYDKETIKMFLELANRPLL